MSDPKTLVRDDSVGLVVGVTSEEAEVLKASMEGTYAPVCAPYGDWVLSLAGAAGIYMRSGRYCRVTIHLTDMVVLAGAERAFTVSLPFPMSAPFTGDPSELAGMLASYPLPLMGAVSPLSGEDLALVRVQSQSIDDGISSLELSFMYGPLQE